MGTIKKMRKEEKRDKMKIGVGTSVTVKVGDINEKIKEGKKEGLVRIWLAGYKPAWCCCV